MNVKEGRVAKAAQELGAAEMEAINRYTRRAYQPEEVYAFSLILCDNDIDRDMERFSVESLETLKELFLGKTCILDHECKSANQTARVFSTGLETVAGRMTKAGEPLVRLTARAYLPRTKGSEETIALIDGGILKEVSVSCSVKRRVCSICGKEQCGHQPGKEYGGKVAHHILMEPTDAYECSFVAVPAQRDAGVTKQFDQGQVDRLLARQAKGEVVLSKAQAGEIGRRFQALAEKARWGERYRQELEKGVLKYSAIVQPEMPRGVMEAAVKALGIEELAEMEKTYGHMAQKVLPLRPQLAAKKPEKPDGNGEFLI